MSVLSTLTGLVYAAAATPSPVPTAPPADEVTPGPWGFIAIFGIGIVVALLIVDMNRRVRRVRYRAEVTAKLDAELVAKLDPETSGASEPPEQQRPRNS